MPTRIIIQHVSASKANQIEQFPLEGYAELTIGRDPSCNINFDAQRDEYVSRRHAAIRIQAGEQPSFRIADLGSRNGTIVNGEKIEAETELVPGDTIELGVGGPKFTFDLQPRPANLMARTRVMPRGGVGETKIISTAEAARSPVLSPSQAEPAKTGVGRNTVIGMLDAQRTQTNRTWMYILAGVLLVVAVAGGGIYYQGRIKAEQAAAELAKHEAELAAQKEAAAKAAEASAAALKQSQEEAAAALKKAQEANEASLKKAVGMTPQDIVRKYGNATVLIEMQWRLYDQTSGKPLYHKTITTTVSGKKVRVPAYVQLANGVIVRWLTTEDEEQTNWLIGMAGLGSGFVISSSGYILTNKHVAAGWKVSYGQEEGYEVGIIFDIGKRQANGMFNPSQRRDLVQWVPEEGLVFYSNAPIPVDPRPHKFEGRNDRLDVRFPGSTLSIAARLLRSSVEADAAEIKVDTEQQLTTVDLSNGSLAPVGEQVTVLGYPAFSSQTVAVISSIEAGQAHQRIEVVPEPTVTAGNISRMSEAAQRTGSTITGGVMGETYQLTVPSGAGNSGGPVFDHDGKVIGLFTYGTRRETTTFAVPIKYGLDLFKVQRSQE